jgi:thioester reductase-like protein
MQAPRGIFLTGATGLVGRYLLRDLLLAGHRVGVLARDTRTATAAERVAELTAFWGESLGTDLPRPVVLGGDLRAPGLGLSAADRRWLARTYGAVVHAAASVSFRPSPDGEPWATNVDGTQHLLDLCAALGLAELHHVSTAFVCGDRRDRVYEHELDRGQGFHNDYERSKFEAERRVRQAPGIRATVYRPAVIVGDSRTGYTSTYHGIYRFLELASRLAGAGPAAPPARRSLPLRLPFTGDEPRNLVTVDWVSQAIVRLVDQPRAHGRTYHLTAERPVPAGVIKEVAEDRLQLEGVRWAGPEGLASPSPLEKSFLDHLGEYRPYFGGDPPFDRRHARAALAGLPPPPVDRAVLARLIRFAVADQWGYSRSRLDCTVRPEAAADGGVDRYFEQFFPEHAPRSDLARAASLAVTVALDIRGPGGGRWTCRWVGGRLTAVERGAGSAEVTYRTDTPTFDAVVRGRQTPQEAFFARRIEVEGDVEKGLKLAVLFGQFVKECPYVPPAPGEAPDVTRVSA